MQIGIKRKLIRTDTKQMCQLKDRLGQYEEKRCLFWQLWYQITDDHTRKLGIHSRKEWNVICIHSNLKWWPLLFSCVTLCMNSQTKAGLFSWTQTWIVQHILNRKKRIKGMKKRLSSALWGCREWILMTQLCYRQIWDVDWKIKYFSSMHDLVFDLIYWNGC